jgi:hypothetical protein
MSKLNQLKKRFLFKKGCNAITADKLSIFLVSIDVVKWPYQE